MRLILAGCLPDNFFNLYFKIVVNEIYFCSFIVQSQRMSEMQIRGHGPIFIECFRVFACVVWNCYLGPVTEERKTVDHRNYNWINQTNQIWNIQKVKEFKQSKKLVDLFNFKKDLIYLTTFLKKHISCTHLTRHNQFQYRRKVEHILASLTIRCIYFLCAHSKM